MDTKILLEKAGIELYPISNKEVLDLVSKYKDIANYFFLPRRRLDDVQFNQIYAGIIVNTKDDNHSKGVASIWMSCPGLNAITTSIR